MCSSTSKVCFSQDDREEVIQAWYMDDSDEDQRLPHHRNPKEFVSFEKLDGMHIFEVVIIRYCRSVSFFYQLWRIMRLLGQDHTITSCFHWCFQKIIFILLIKMYNSY